MSAGLSVAAQSHTGKVRTHNQDTFVVGQQVWAVADGMGGRAAGQVASQIAARCLRRYDSAGPVNQAGVLALIQTINDEILAYGLRHPVAYGLGTTLAGLAALPAGGHTHWLVFHVGDSRVYRLADGRLIRETSDHSQVQALVDVGAITASQARDHPQRHLLTRCLGSRATPRVDLRVVPRRTGDWLLVCSDGLTSEIDDEVIERVLAQAEAPADAAHQLVDRALAAGGRDNVTAVVVRVDPARQASVARSTPPLAELAGAYHG
jgi:protein phosphatase